MIDPVTDTQAASALKNVSLPLRCVTFAWPMDTYLFIRPEPGRSVAIRGRLTAVAAYASNGLEHHKQYHLEYVDDLGVLHQQWFDERQLDSDTT